MPGMLPQFWPDVKHCQGLFNQIGQLILAIVGVCATICITLLGRVLLSTSPPLLVSTNLPPGQHKLKHDDTLACFARHGASYMLMRLGGECGLIMELSPHQAPHSFNTNK